MLCPLPPFIFQLFHRKAPLLLLLIIGVGWFHYPLGLWHRMGHLIIMTGPLLLFWIFCGLIVDCAVPYMMAENGHKLLKICPVATFLYPSWWIAGLPPIAILFHLFELHSKSHCWVIEWLFNTNNKRFRRRKIKQ